jgi:hypothetical protein
MMIRGNMTTMKAHKITVFAAIFDLYGRFATLLNDFERPTTPKSQANRTNNIKANPPMLKVALQLRLFDLTTDETFRVKDRVGRVRVECIFGRVTDPSLRVRSK